MNKVLDILKEEHKEHPIAVETTMAILVLMEKIFKNPIDAVPMMRAMIKMMEDEDYIPDKMVEMPGNNLDAEQKLKELMGIILGRRI